MWRVWLALACAFSVLTQGCGGASPRRNSTSTGTVPGVTTPFKAEGLLLPGHPVELSVPPPQAVARAGGDKRAEFNLGRTVVAQSGCLACHRIAGQGNPGPGPDLSHVGSKLSRAGVEHAIIYPTEPMPSFAHLPKAKLRAVVEFLSLLQ